MSRHGRQSHGREWKEFRTPPLERKDMGGGFLRKENSHQEGCSYLLKKITAHNVLA